VPTSTSPLPAKVVSLRVRPFGVSHLCFETDGILGDLNLSLNPNAAGLLGAVVPAFDFDLFYAILGSIPNGIIDFTINPAVGTTIVLNGTTPTTWTFVSSLTTGNQLLIGATLAATLAAAVPVLQASTDTNTGKFRYSASATVLILSAATGAPGGNPLTISTTVPGAIASGADPSRLLYDFPQIRAFVAPFTLATLRAEPRKAALNKAINARQNAYFAKYGNLQGPHGIIKRMNEYYSPTITGSKPIRLDTLSSLAQLQADQLHAAYSDPNDVRTGVVKETKSIITSDTSGYGYSAVSEETHESAISESGGAGSGHILMVPPEQPAPLPAPTWPPPLPQPPERAGDTKGWDPSVGGGSGSGISLQISNSYQTVSNNDAAHQVQGIVTTGYGYRMPDLENQARNERAQISLIDQKFAAFMYAQNLPNLAQVFANELNSIDSDVYRLQIAYLNTILMSPIPGVVTGIYKNPGEAVRAGEPVIRVENYTVILLEASLIFRGLISIGQAVTVTTALFDASSEQPTSIGGVVVAARGKSDDDQWQVIVECKNMNASNQPIFPLGYRFDYDDTTLAIG
jgi:hypothetical protein